jgi:hypothetical protein
MHRRIRLLAALPITAMLIAAVEPCPADTFTWIGQIDGTWDATQAAGADMVTTNWSTDPVPTATAIPDLDDTVEFINATSNAAIGLNGDRSVEGLVFGGGQGYTLNNNILTLLLGAVSSSGTATHNINSNLLLGANSVWNIDGTSNVVVNGTFADMGGPFSFTKSGTGTLTIATGTDLMEDFNQGALVIEAGTLAVMQGGGNSGELWNTSIRVSSGATFDVSDFTSYEVQIGESLGGAGTVVANELAIFGDNGLDPGDNGVGTLDITGNVTLSNLAQDALWSYDLGDTTTVGGTENDLIAVSGSITAPSSPAVILSVTPVDGSLATGTYTLMTHNSASAPATNLILDQVVDNNGTLLNQRQTFNVTSTNTQVNVEVSGSAMSLTWNGGAGTNAWDVATTNNWTSGGASTFMDLDNVTFGAGGEKTVTIADRVTPGSATFNSASTYTFTGSGGITGYGPVNVDSGVVQLFNTGNDFKGTTTVAGGARLEMVGAMTGGMVVDGTLAAINNTLITPIDDFEDTSLGEYTFAKILDQGTVTNTSFESPAGVLANISAGADGAEQALLVRSDFQLAVGQELRVDNAFGTADAMGQPGDFGIAVGETPSDLGDGGSGDVRTDGDFLFISFRGLNQLNSRGFNGIDGEIGQAQAFGANADQLFIARPTENTIEMGWYDGVTRNVLRAETEVSPDIFDNIGFYGDLRVDAAGYSGLDNLRFQVGPEDIALHLDGNLMLGSTGTLEFEIKDSGLANFDVMGTASLAGMISVTLDEGVTPTEGEQYTLVSTTGGIDTTGITYDLPDSFSASVVGGLDLVLTFGAGGLPGDYNEDGVVNAADYIVWRNHDGTAFDLPNRNPSQEGNVDQADYDFWVNNFGAPNGSGTGSAPVPEPTSWLLISLGILLARGQRRRR